MSLPRPLSQMLEEARRDDWHMIFVGSDIRCLIVEAERLQAIVDRLPKTADGVPVVPGMRLWFVNARHEVAEVGPMKMADSEGWLSDFEVDVYSTAEAAEAAKEKP